MKISIISVILSFAVITASAQVERVLPTKQDSVSIYSKSDNTNKQSRKERFKELDLTKEQKGKLKEIMQAGKAAKEAIESNTKLSDEEKKMKKRALQKAQMQKIQAILTPEQLEKFKASRQDNP